MIVSIRIFAALKREPLPFSSFPLFFLYFKKIFPNKKSVRKGGQNGFMRGFGWILNSVILQKKKRDAGEGDETSVMDDGIEGERMSEESTFLFFFFPPPHFLCLGKSGGGLKWRFSSPQKQAGFILECTRVGERALKVWFMGDCEGGKGGEGECGV